MSIPSVSIQNKNGVTMLLDESDLGLLSQSKKGYWCFSLSNDDYAQMNHKKRSGGTGQTVPAHRLIMGLPMGLQVDHINRNTLDNRKENLRLCTSSQNRMNSAGYGTSCFKGISRLGKKWRVQFQMNGSRVYLGVFTTELEAALAYDAAARLQGCEFQFLNFPDEDINA